MLKDTRSFLENLNIDIGIWVIILIKVTIFTKRNKKLCRKRWKLIYIAAVNDAYQIIYQSDRFKAFFKTAAAWVKTFYHNWKETIHQTLKKSVFESKKLLNIRVGVGNFFGPKAVSKDFWALRAPIFNKYVLQVWFYMKNN